MLAGQHLTAPFLTSSVAAPNSPLRRCYRSLRTGESVAGSSAAAAANTIGMRFSFIEKVRFALILMRTCCGYRPAAICNPEAARENVVTQLNGYLEEFSDVLFQQKFGLLRDNAVLADIADIAMGQSPAGSSYNEDGVGAIFYQGRAEFGWRYPTPRLFTTEPKRMAKAGDVLMSVRAPVGDLNLAYEDCCIGRGLAAIHCNYPSYGLYLMRSLHRKLDAYNGEGTVFGSINSRALKGLPVALPDDAAIREFEKETAPIDAQIRSNEAESRSLAALRDALLPKLMSGDIDLLKVNITQLNSHLAA